MPYNTRRVSLSLPSLGIHVPGNGSHRHSAHRYTLSPPSDTSLDNQHPSKRIKRAHALSAPSSTTATPVASRTLPPSADEPLGKPAGPANATPPPSPGNGQQQKIDKEGINDDVVIAVLEQLEDTGNRPHLIKELAAVLSHSLKVVETSANPVAIISSRLTNYLRRSWTALAPCPLTKEQVAVHPRRVYYFLTTRPRQDIPEYTDAIASIPANGRVISPSVSIGPEDDEELEEIAEPIRVEHDDDMRERDAMSPELELDDFEMADNFKIFAEPDPPALCRNRAQSPPLEYDEREFSATACSMQERKLSEEAERRLRQASESESGSDSSMHSSPAPESMSYSVGSVHGPETEESAALANQEAASALFGAQVHHSRLGLPDSAFHFSSPLLRPMSMHGEKHLAGISPRKTPFVFGAGAYDTIMSDVGLSNSSGWDMGSPEAVGLNELDDLLGGF